MAHLSDKANQLREKYYNKYGMPPRCWSHGEETMNEYENFLENEINKSNIKVLFVCLGNICRSPMAEFIFKDMIYKKDLTSDFIIKSAATSYEEIGSDMHYGAKNKLNQKNIPFSKRKACIITPKDYEYYDFIIGMEESNIRNIKRIVGKDIKNKISRLLDYSDNPRDIADPWYTGNFETAYNDIVEGCIGFLNYLEGMNILYEK